METRKQAIIEALRNWIAQRPGMDPRDYGGASDYRVDSRRITRQKNDALILMRAVELHDSLTADDLIRASEGAFSGRLTITLDWGWQLVETDTRGKPVGIVSGFGTESEALARLDEWRAAGNVANADRHHARPAQNRARIRYCTGQYWPTEYRAAVCAVLASALWGDAIDKVPGEGEGVKSAGDWLRAHFAREFGRGIASRWFA